MAKFFTGNELNSEIEKIFEKAEQKIILISPYIKLHDRYASTLKTKRENPAVKIILVFGKNENDISRSMKQEDFIFFKEFPNIEIRYEKRLHAKFYSNESTAIITSMNLYDFSQDHNIEAGVLTTTTLLGNLISDEDSFDKKAHTYFDRVIDQSDLLFKKIPEYEANWHGLTKKYKTSIIETDKLTDFFANKANYGNHDRKSNSEKTPVGFVKSNNIEEIALNNTVSSNIKFLSTTALSKEVGVSGKDLFSKFEKLNWIERKNSDWILTSTGKSKGAQMKSGQHGEYIAWPDSIIKEIR